MLSNYDVIGCIAIAFAERNQKTSPITPIHIDLIQNDKLQKKEAIFCSIIRLLNECDVSDPISMICAGKNQKTLLITPINNDPAYQHRFPKTSKHCFVQ